MNRRDRVNLLGEKTSLERMIAGTPQEDVLDRGSLVARLEGIQQFLDEDTPDERAEVRFTDVGQVKTSLARLSRENLRENEEILAGEIQGVLPKARTFEFKLADSGQVIRGRIGLAIPNADALNDELHQPTRIKVMVTRVGTGRPTYLLLEELKNAGGASTKSDG